MRVLLVLACAIAVGCNPITGPDCRVLERKEIRAAAIIEGRIVFITVIAPKVEKCATDE